MAKRAVKTTAKKATAAASVAKTYKSTAKAAAKSTAKALSGKSTAKAAAKSTAKALSGKSTAKAAGKSTAKAAGKSTAKAAGKTATKAAEKLPESRRSSRSAVAGRFETAPPARGTVIERRGSSGTQTTRIEQAVDHYRKLLASVNRTLRVQLIDAVAPDEKRASADASTDELLWGPQPSDAEVSAAELAQLRTQFERRRELAAHSITREAAAELLNISMQAVTGYLQNGALTGLKDGKQWLLPSWQFDADCERGFVPGIAAVATAFPGGAVSLSRWVTRPNPDFDDRTPRELMAAGHVDEVVDAAAALTAAGW
jgi:hypothetical protein